MAARFHVSPTIRGITFFVAALAASMAQAQSTGSLAERLQVLEDQEAIRALILAYGAAHDGRDYRSFSELFADEGEWVGGLGSAKGPQAIFELMDSTIGHDPQPEGSGTYHVMTNDQIEIDGDRASATTKWIYITPGDNGGPNMVFLGHYDDRFIREDGVWKFLRREAPVDIASTPTMDLTAQDYADIRQLIDTYPHLLDNCRNNGNDYADLYTDDGTFGVSSEWGRGAKIWFRGREELRRAGGGTDNGCRPRPPIPPSYHVNINASITPTAEGAWATSTLLTITNDTDDRGDIVHWEGGYEDTFEKTPDGWRFKSRVHVWPEVEWTDRPQDMPPRNLADE